MLDIFQFHHLVSEEFERPALPPIGSLATRQMNQLGFSLAIQTSTLWTFSREAPGESLCWLLGTSVQEISLLCTTE